MVPIDVGTALIINGDAVAIQINATNFSTTPSNAPPDVLNARIVVRGDEIWARGTQGGLVRYRFR